MSRVIWLNLCSRLIPSKFKINLLAHSILCKRSAINIMSMDIGRVTKLLGSLASDTAPTDAALGYVYRLSLPTTSLPKYCLITAGRDIFNIGGLFIGFSTTTTNPESEFSGQHTKSSIIQFALSIKWTFSILKTTDNKDGLHWISDKIVVDLLLLINYLNEYNMFNWFTKFW